MAELFNLGLRDDDPLKEYKNVMMRSLKLAFPSLLEDEIAKVIDFSMEKRFKDADCTLLNNYKNKEVTSTLKQMVDYISSKKPIITAYGVLFARHGDVVNPYYNFIESLADLRTKYKNEMFKYPKGTEMFNKYNLLQLLAKIDMNGLYGTFGAPSSVFFNLHVAPSITTMGKSIISASITFFESFLANNVQFGSLDEVVTFIDNIRMEKAGRKLKDNDIIDENISLTKCFYKIMATTGYMWVPSEKEAMIIWDMLSRVSQEDLNRIYYKNNLFEFCENKKVSSFLVSMLMALKSPFLNPNKVPEEIKDHMNIFLGWVKEYVYYEYITLDKLDRIETMPRDTVLIVDTDSCIISLEAWYQFLADKTKGIDMAIKHQKYDVIKLIEADEFGDMPKKKVVELIDFDYDYDFYNDKLVATHRAVEPLKLIPQDGLRCSIIDIMSYTISQLILDYMRNFCDKHYSSSPGRKCLLIMKNEFLFKSILLTYVKKHYAANTLVQEGNMVPKNAALSVTGLELDKAGTPKSTADELKRILFEEILDSETGVDQMKILNSLAVLEKKIFKSLVSGETTYHKPARIKPMTSYAMPMRIQGIKAAYAYNTLRPADSDPIDLEKRNSLLIIKTKLDKKTVEDIKNDDPAMYKKAVELLSAKEYKAGITSIAIQFGDPIPEWIIRFIDYDNIINDNLKGFPTDEVGINTLGNGNIPYTNLLTL